MSYLKNMISPLIEGFNLRSPNIVRTVTTIGALWCSYQAINILRFAHLYMLRSSTLQRYLDPPTSADAAVLSKDTASDEPWALITGSSDGKQCSAHV